jgi:hypothetical protein
MEETEEILYCPFHEYPIIKGSCDKCDTDAAENLSWSVQDEILEWKCFKGHINSIELESCKKCSVTMLESQTIERLTELIKRVPPAIKVRHGPANDDILRPVVMEFWFRARVPWKGYRFESQIGLQCGKHSLNNLLGLDVFDSNSSNSDNVSIYSNFAYRVNINVVHNYICRFGLDTTVDINPLRYVERENYGYDDLLLSLALIGYGVDGGIGWRLEGDYFKCDHKPDRYHKKNVAGWIIHTGNSDGGHWTCIKYDGRNSYYLVDSLREGPLLTYIPSSQRAYIVYYDYIVNTRLIDNGHPEENHKWETEVRSMMEKAGICHHSDLYQQFPMKP